MKIIISGDGTKRTLPEEFEVCISVADLKALKRIVDAALVAAEDRGATYGWIMEVRNPLPHQANTPPKGWSE